MLLEKSTLSSIWFKKMCNKLYTNINNLLTNSFWNWHPHAYLAKEGNFLSFLGKQANWSWGRIISALPLFLISRWGGRLSLFFSEPGRKEWDILKRVKFIYSECRWDKVIPKAKSQHAGIRARKMKGREGQDKRKRREKNPHNFVWVPRSSHTWKYTHISTCWRWNWSQRFGTKAGLYKTKDLSIPCLGFAY